MKNVLKAFGIIAIVAIMGFSFAALSLTGCGGGDDGGSGGGNTGGTGGTGGAGSSQTFSSISDFSYWLKAQPDNTIATAYLVKLNVNMNSTNGEGLRNVLNYKLYVDSKLVILDLSGSTFPSNTIPRDFFMGTSAPFGCPTLVGLIIGNSVTSIGESSITGCSNLTSVTIPNSVTNIGNSAFAGDKSLTSVTFATGSNIMDANFGTTAFPEGSTGAGGNTLKTAYSTGKAGTYTRTANGTTWTKK